MTLYDVHDTSYKTPEQQAQQLKKFGYKYDSILSNDNEQIYYNPNEHRLLYNVSGTHNLSDWGTDALLALGDLKDIQRYEEADNRLKAAKMKYNVDKATITGHSLGGTVASYIGGKDDKIYTYNKGITISQKQRDNEKSYREENDIVSSLSYLDGLETTTFNDKHHFLDVLGNHSVENLKDKNIFID